MPLGGVALGLGDTDPSEPLLVGLAEVDRHPFHAGWNHQEIGAHVDREQGRGPILVDHCLDAVYTDWGTPQQAAIRHAAPGDLTRAEFAEGSMGPKVKAACRFVEHGGEFAAIGSIDDAPALLSGIAGTTVSAGARAGLAGVASPGQDART